MKKNKTTLSKGDNLPPRGRGKRFLVLEAIREANLLNLTKDSSYEETEKAFFGHMAQRAMTPDDPASGMLMKELRSIGWASLKPTHELVNFDLDSKLLPHEQANQVMQAAADGQIPPDVANTFITSMAAMLKIEEVTELQKRLEAIEAKLLG